MVNHTHTIHRLLPTNFLSEFDHFVGLALKGLNLRVMQLYLFQSDVSFQYSLKIFGFMTFSGGIKMEH